MKIGFIGLGRMGGNMVERLLRSRHEVVVYDMSKDAIKISEKKGATGAESLKDLVYKAS